MFEITAKDAAGRLGKWTTPRGTIETPNIAIVVNPNIRLIEPEEIAKLGFSLLITNSYILMRSPRRAEVEEKGLHKFLNWEGPIYTDSGAFQLYSQRIDNIDPQETFAFQQKIGSNICTPLDVFTLPDEERKIALKKLKETDRRYDQLVRKEGTFTAGPVQGGAFLDLRKRAAQLVGKHNFDVHAIGGIVPLMETYQYMQLCDTIVTCKQYLPLNKPVHAFGAGHPMVFALLTALGCDLFDSAMYAIAARRGGYLTPNGTLRLEGLREFPCPCTVCETHTPDEVRKMEERTRERTLALHNLHVTAAELRLVRQAIHEQWLWELVAQRTRAHPMLFKAFLHTLKTHQKYFQEFESVTKNTAFFYTGEEALYRPEAVRVREWVKRVKGSKYVKKEPFGKVPVELAGTYPIGQSVTLEDVKIKRADPEQIARATIDYLYGKGTNRAFTKVHADVSETTGRLRRVHARGTVVGTIRSSDGFFIPTFEGAKVLHKKLHKPAARVVVHKDAVPFTLKGKSVFAKFVERAENIHAGEEVLVVDSRDRLLATGTALMSHKEMRDFDRGVAVTVRHTKSQKSDTGSDKL